MAFQNRSAYGDIYTIPTSTVDGIANRIYQEQKIREQQKLQQDKALDDEFAKNVAGVKSADIPDITSAYNEFKQAHINLQKKGNKATPQDQMEVMVKKANAFQAINASKEEKERVKNIGGEVKADKKGKFIPTASQRLAERLNTPTSKIKEEDWDVTNKYSFPEMADFTKRILGTPKPKKINLTTPSKKGELYDDKEVFQEYNNPNKMYEDAYIQGSSMANKDGFINTMLSSLDDNEKEALKERYFAKVSSPEFKKIYGEVKPFPESAGKTDLGEATALMVMGMVDKIPITPQETISELNAERASNKKRKEGMEDWRTKNALTYQQSLAKIRLNNQNRKDGLPTEETGYLSDEVADEVGENQTVTLGGKQREVKVIYTDKVDPKRLDIISAKKQVRPIPIKQTDGSLRMGYYQDRTTGDWEGLDANGNTRIISRERVKDDYIKEAAPTKFKNQTGTKASENTKGTKTSTKQTIPNF